MPARPTGAPGPPRGSGHRGLLYTPAVAVAAVLAFAFDPLLHLGERAIRWETLGLAGAIFLVLVGTLVLSRRAAAGSGLAPFDPADGGPLGGGRTGDHPALAADDLLFIALGVVPGALVGGRLGYLLLHFDYYQAHLGEILDPARGGLQLSLALVGGLAGGSVVARLLEAPLGRWLHVATLPVLVGMALGKVAMALGGTGQGAPSDAPWATAYLGPGPWGSLAPEIPSHPAQLYEAGGDLVLALLFAVLLGLGAFARRDGLLCPVGLAGWSVIRFLVAFTWRDAPVLGPLRADQLISVGLLAGSLVVVIGLAVARRRALRAVDPDTLRWPDPELALHWREGRRRPNREQR